MRRKNIDTSTTAGKIEVMRAFLEGKKLAWKSAKGSTWFPLSGEPRWYWHYYDFAVVEEPAEVWVVWNTLFNRFAGCFDSKKVAEDAAAAFTETYGPNYRVRKFVEVED
jgi:hypothetical protein